MVGQSLWSQGLSPHWQGYGRLIPGTHHIDQAMAGQSIWSQGLSPHWLGYGRSIPLIPRTVTTLNGLWQAKHSDPTITLTRLWWANPSVSNHVNLSPDTTSLWYILQSRVLHLYICLVQNLYYGSIKSWFTMFGWVLVRLVKWLMWLVCDQITE